MGQRPDDLTPQHDDFNTSFERSQEIAGRNAEQMRENLSSTPNLAEETAGVTGVARSDYVVEEPGVPGERGETAGAESGESTDEIRGNIEDTRARMGTTIDAIQEKLSPQNLMQQAKETARDATIGRAQEMASNVADTARQTGSTLMDTIRSNPVPVALAAVGLGWLFMSARRQASERREQQYWYRGDGRYGDRYRGTYRGDYHGGYYASQQPQQQGVSGRVGQMTDRIQDTAGKVTDQVQETAGKVGDQVQGVASNVADKASDAADYAQWQAQRARGWFEQTWDDNPLLVAGAALALGTVVGLAIPETQMENRLMGDARDTLVQKAQGVAQDTVQKAQQAATQATDQVASQANQQQAQQQARSGKGS